jgi:putative membrane protein
MRKGRSNHNRWLLSGVCGIALLTVSGTAALAQVVSTTDATTPQGSGAATQIIQLKPGQEAGTPTVSPADTAGNPMASTQDARFVWAASSINQAEIALGRLAQTRGQTTNEQNFGQMLVADHTNAEQALTPIAETLMLKVSPGLSPMQTAMYQQLQSVPADQFDMSFNQAMIHGHQHALAIFQREAMSGESAQLRAYAHQTIPTIENHLQLAQSMSPMPMAGGVMASTTAAPGMMPPPPPGPVPGSISDPVAGNPDHSADQLNGRILQFNSQS